MSHESNLSIKLQNKSYVATVQLYRFRGIYEIDVNICFLDHLRVIRCLKTIIEDMRFVIFEEDIFDSVTGLKATFLNHFNFQQ